MKVSLDHVRHRYLVAEGPGAVYVACMGTKEVRAAWGYTMSKESGPRAGTHSGLLHGHQGGRV